MPTYGSFEELPVWQLAADLAAKIFPWTSASCFRGQGDLANQIQRATLSISNNIAEGFERGTTKELLHFLYIARGSAGEVRSMLCVMERMDSFDHLKSDISNFKSDFESVARQIRAWADHLQNSEIKGQKHLNDQSRKRFERGKSRSDFLENQKLFREKMKEDLERKVRERNLDE
jgi:four helix bundle protein